jgi:DNA (cytosine-5)-methyltransferase 1
LENVKRLVSHDGGRTLETILQKLREIGYTVHYKVLNSLDFGIPQKRERIYIVGFLKDVDFSFPEKLGSYKSLSTILENDDLLDRKYFLSEEIKAKRFEKVKPNYPTPSIWHENIGANISALPYSCALRAGGSYNYLVVNGVRRLTERELLRLQGFPENFKINIPYSELRKVAGNSVTVPVIEKIAEKMLVSLSNFEGV